VFTNKLPASPSKLLPTWKV